MKKTEQGAELAKCLKSVHYFVHQYCWIYDAMLKGWVPFALWEQQVSTLMVLAENRLVIVLKARQLGLTWLALCFALWHMIFQPVATILIFSRRDDESVYLLGDERMRGVYSRLPHWMKKGFSFLKDSAHEWQLSNGSIARAFPTTAGDSYTASMVIVDEADLVPDLNRLMRATKPTIDAGGRMALISRADKSNPQSEFKNIYRGAKLGETEWVPVFLPWHARPGRDRAWYAAQMAEIFHRTGSLDDLHEQYPETDVQALAPRSLDKRLPGRWLEKCYVEVSPLAELPDGAPSIDQLQVFTPPRSRHTYIIGLDPAEGNPTSDDSALQVIDLETGEQVAKLQGKFQPSMLASHADAIGRWYNNAMVMVERNNHGHAVLLWFSEFSNLRVLNGQDGKPGWLSSMRGKALLYDLAADAFRYEETELHDFETFTQLASIEGGSLRAPEGEPDDLADAFALALAAKAQNPRPAPLGPQSGVMLPSSVWE